MKRLISTLLILAFMISISGCSLQNKWRKDTEKIYCDDIYKVDSKREYNNI